MIKSDPRGGTTTTRGSVVTLTVSKGPKLSKVPVLVGTARSLAVQQIRGRGLVPSVTEEASSKPNGEVIRQAPSAGSELPRGSEVAIVVSKGEQKSKIPNVIGKERRRSSRNRSVKRASTRRCRNSRPRSPRRSAASPISFRRRAPKSNPAPP